MDFQFESSFKLAVISQLSPSFEGLSGKREEQEDETRHASSPLSNKTSVDMENVH